jgi:hypothetical protein
MIVSFRLGHGYSIAGRAEALESRGVGTDTGLRLIYLVTISHDL